MLHVVMYRKITVFLRFFAKQLHLSIFFMQTMTCTMISWITRNYIQFKLYRFTVCNAMAIQSQHWTEINIILKLLPVLTFCCYLVTVLDLLFNHWVFFFPLDYKSWIIMYTFKNSHFVDSRCLQSCNVVRYL